VEIAGYQSQAGRTRHVQDPELFLAVAARKSSLTDLITTVLHKDPSVTTIAIQYVDPERWFVDGVSTAPAVG
jgi:hypothetical protein